MDIFLPRMSGIECTAQLKAMPLKTQIIILTAMEDDELIFLALKAGADGYILKRTTPAELRLALLGVLHGGVPMTGEIARRVIESFRQESKSRKSNVSLSVREEQILTLLSKGYSNKMIAERLKLSIDTICYHLKRIFEKMHVSSRTEAVARYMTPHPPSDS
jgi:DNA-binding NarL/FixJ family response regulator